MWHSAQLWIKTRKTTLGSCLEFEDGSQRRWTGKVDKEEMILVCVSTLNINSNMSLEANNPKIVFSPAASDANRFSRKDATEATLLLCSLGWTGATTVLKLPCHKQGFSRCREAVRPTNAIMNLRNRSK